MTGRTAGPAGGPAIVTTGPVMIALSEFSMAQRTANRPPPSRTRMLRVVLEARLFTSA
ncbi:hypothetical protein F6W96_19525 [Nocardia terpenica]|uniref:Uncharacterized protein n=1 Tax=Nocardia terpenica TaxID=455432 RepID=A0A6G9Z3I6_9NOCA|nr:hypothetical protein F6W96_19525 [Nocardia terpenica]